MSELTKEKIYKKELIKAGGEGNSNIERIRSLAGGGSALEDIVDKNGNPRFIEGTVTTTTIQNIKYTYKKWSLSGTHLMIVLAGEATANAAINPNQEFADLVLPPFIRSKIATLTPEGRISSSPLWSFVGYEATNLKNISLSSYSADGPLQIIGWATGNFTIPKGTFRIQFDLLIDAE